MNKYLKYFLLGILSLILVPIIYSPIGIITMGFIIKERMKEEEKNE